MKTKILLCFILFSTFSAYASSCEIVEVRKVKGLFKDRFRKEIPALTLDECLEEAKAHLGRENIEKYVYRSSSGKSHRSKRRVLLNAELKTVKVIMKFKGQETSGHKVVTKFKL